MFQRYAVTYTIDGTTNDTTSTVDTDLDPRAEIATQIACRRFGRAEMADHVEIDDLTPIGEPKETP